jgi:hypothetical protein
VVEEVFPAAHELLAGMLKRLCGSVVAMAAKDVETIMAYMERKSLSTPVTGLYALGIT